MGAPVDSGSSTHGQLAREQLILKYVPLVRRAVGHLAIRASALLDSEDLYSYGTVGLIDAIDRFDASRGVTFETYAVIRIRGYLQDQLRAMDWLSRGSRARVRTIQRATAEMEERLGRRPEWREVAEASGLSAAACEQALADSGCQVLSLERLTEEEDGEGMALRHRLEDERSPNPASTTEENELRGSVAAALACLPEREREIIRLRYQGNWTLKQVAAQLGVSPSRAAQLHNQALARLRRQLAAGFDELTLSA